MVQSFISHFSHDVFLSFRGEDTRYNFTGNLYNAFHRRGINIFLDDQNLRVGDGISSSLLKAIEESRIFIIVFSKNYASSTWCLEELVKILECMEQNNQLVYPIFYKVDPSDLRHQKNNYGRAMAAHEVRFGKDSKKVLDWRSALTKVANLKGDHFKTGYEHDFIENILKKVSTRLPPKGLHVGEHVVGLKSRLEEVMSLLDISSHSTACILGIHGVGGVGKTTLITALYNSIVHHFEYASFLSDVRETSNQYKGLVSLQQTLLSKMLQVEDVKLSSVYEGAYEIKSRLCNRRVLLVLDDVDCNEQLEMLVGDCNWFGLGSRIIVTTRDKQLLHAHLVEKKYEMKELKYHEAFELFCLKAFNSSQPPERFMGLTNEIVNYAEGLPLALKVIGSNLFGKDLDEFKCALDQYKRIPSYNIQRILRISYDALEDNQKEIFLDIACFFKGCSLEDVKTTLDACGFFPKYHIGVLVDKSLIVVDQWGCIQMHNLIQDMGREVVREAAPKEPGRRSRLCFEEDVIKVLQENSGTHNIEGIKLNSHHQKIQWNGAAFKKMKNLRILIIRNVCFSVGPKYLPNTLRFLEWEQCRLTSLPSGFDPNKLVILKMPHSYLKLEKSFEKFKNMSVINFSSCQSITELPDMSECSSLRHLNLSYCENLVKVHDSLGFLTKITHVYLKRCKNLTTFPSAIQMTSLQSLDINDCTSLEHFPDILGDMDCLEGIYASNTAIKELPNSIGSNLVSIPASIKKLSNLCCLAVEGCKKLQEIYELPPTSVLWSQAIPIPEAQIPDWFDHRCEGGVLSFWSRGKLPDVSFAFICSIPDADFKLLSSFNGVEVENFSCGWYIPLIGSQETGVYVENLHWHWPEDVERYLVHEWNYIEIKVTVTEIDDMTIRRWKKQGDRDMTIRRWKKHEDRDLTISKCGLHVYKKFIEDVRFECPYSTMSAVVHGTKKCIEERKGTSSR